MGTQDFLSLLPHLIVGGALILILIATAVKRSYLFSVIVSLCAFAGAIALLLLPAAAGRVGTLLVLDAYARFFSVVILGANACVALLAYAYLREYRENREEFSVLLLLETLGAMVLVASTHFASFFLGLELLSVSLYGLLGYVRTRRVSFEAGLKYFVPAAVSSAFLLFGMALLYRETGSMDLAAVGRALAGTGAGTAPGAGATIAVAGLIMVIVAIGFKLALVPFHMWAADVYQGASAPVTASIATVSKIGMFALFYRFFAGLPLSPGSIVTWVLVVLAVLSMLGGSWLALGTRNVKRMLAYSSTSHLGYMMIPLLAGGSAGVAASSFYLVAYSLTTLGLFGIVTALSGVEREPQMLEDFAGMAWKRPLLSVVFIVMLLSIAGIPLTAGFIGKFYLLAAGVGASQWVLAGSLVLSSGIGLFYYLRLVAVQLAKSSVAPAASGLPPARAVSIGTGLVLALTTAAILGLGLFPGPLLAVVTGLSPLP